MNGERIRQALDDLDGIVQLIDNADRVGKTVVLPISGQKANLLSIVLMSVIELLGDLDD